MRTPDFNASNVAEERRAEYAQLVLDTVGSPNWVITYQYNPITERFDVHTKHGTIEVLPETSHRIPGNMWPLVKDTSDIRLHIGLCYLIEKAFGPAYNWDALQATLTPEAPHWGDELAEYLEDHDIIPHQS